MTSPETIVGYNFYDTDLDIKLNTSPIAIADLPYIYNGLTADSVHHLAATAVNAAGLESAQSLVVAVKTDDNPVRGQPIISGTQATIDGIINAALDPSTYLFGAIVGITTPDGDYYQAYGTSDGTVPLTTDYRWRFGSCTKMFTALLVLAQIDAGHITLNDTLDMYVSGVVNGDIITIQQLLQMQSGIEDYLQQDATLSEEYFLTPTAAIDPLPYIRSFAPLFEPGTQCSYSNSNYFLLGMILEWCDATYGTSRDIATIITDDCVNALGLTSTEWPTGDYMTPMYARGWTANLALPTIQSEISTIEAEFGGLFNSLILALAPNFLPPGASLNPYVEFTAVDPSWAGAAGVLDGTVRDAVTFGLALNSGALLSPAMQQFRADTWITYLTYTPNTAPYSLTNPYNGPGWMGMGLGIISWGSWWGWIGSFAGYICVLFANPVNDSVIVVMMNSMQSEDQALNAFYQIAYLMYPELTELQTENVLLDSVTSPRSFGSMTVVLWGPPGEAFPYTFPATLS